MNPWQLLIIGMVASHLEQLISPRVCPQQAQWGFDLDVVSSIPGIAVRLR